MDDPNTLSEIVNPTTVTGAAATVALSLIAGIFRILNRRADRDERARPSITQVWKRLDEVEQKNAHLEEMLGTEQRGRRKVENKLSKVLRIVDAYARRVVASGGPPFTDEEQREIDDTAGFLEQ